MNVQEYLIENCKNRLDRWRDDILDIDWGHEDIRIKSPMECIRILGIDCNDIELSLRQEFENGKNRNIDIIYQEDEIDPDYCIFREATHDGTLLFTLQLMGEIFAPLINGEAYCMGNKPDDYTEENVANYNVRYTINDLVWYVDYGIKHINDMVCAGETEVMALPVKVEYFKNSNKTKRELV
jgi:hypothetical protein